MNKIYDFDSIFAIRKEQKRLIMLFALFCLCLIAAVAIACSLIENNLLLTAIFALLLLGFLTASVLLWKIKYAILRDYLTFLDNMETGSRQDFAGIFEEKQDASQGAEPFDCYVFCENGKKHSLLIHVHHPAAFVKGKSYRLECVGRYVYQWELME